MKVSGGDLQYAVAGEGVELECEVRGSREAAPVQWSRAGAGAVRLDPGTALNTLRTPGLSRATIRQRRQITQIGPGTGYRLTGLRAIDVIVWWADLQRVSPGTAATGAAAAAPTPARWWWW